MWNIPVVPFSGFPLLLARSRQNVLAGGSVQVAPPQAAQPAVPEIERVPQPKTKQSMQRSNKSKVALQRLGKLCPILAG